MLTKRRNVRIVLVTETYCPALTPISEAIDLEAQELRSRGHEVWVMTPDQPSLQHADPFVVEVPAVPLPNGSPYHLSFPGLGQVESLIRRADFIHSYEPLALGQWAAEQSAEHHRPFLYTFHPEILRHYRLPLTGHSERRTIGEVIRTFTKLASAVLIPHPHLGAEIAAHGVTVPIHTVPIPLNLEPFQTGSPIALHEQFKLDPAMPLFLTFGGEDQLLNALARLPERPHLMVAEPNAGFQQQVHSRGISSWVHVLEPGFQPELFASVAAVLISSDDYQNLRRVLEAGIAGVPVVAPDTVALREVVKNRQTGLLVPSTKTGFDHAIRQLLYRPTLRARLGRQARQHVVQLASPYYSVNRLLDVAALVRRLHTVKA